MPDPTTITDAIEQAALDARMRYQCQDLPANRQKKCSFELVRIHFEIKRCQKCFSWNFKLRPPVMADVVWHG
jgi:hypothetical protein